MDALYSYTDYRQYLRDYFTHKKAGQCGFSLRIIADRAGFRARDYILRVMNGTRNLSQSGSFKLSEALGFSEKERTYFINLVAFNQAKTPREKEFFYRKMADVVKYGRQQQLRQHQFDYFSEWYYSALRSILPVMNFGDDFAAIGRFLSPPLTAGQVKKAIRVLVGTGLLHRDEAGNYQVETSQLAAGDAVRSVAMVQFHQQSLDLARRALERYPAEERDVSGVTMTLSQKGFDKVREEIAAFRKKVMCIAEQDTNEERAWQVNVQLFPLSKRRES
jgi:uncharacterized protein (TIGR02147 family)